MTESEERRAAGRPAQAAVRQAVVASLIVAVGLVVLYSTFSWRDHTCLSDRGL